MLKVLLLLSFLVTILSCKDTPSENKSDRNTHELAAEKKNCSTERKYGDITICFPKIEGMVECHKDVNVATHFAKFEDPQNELLAYYLNEETYTKRDSLGLFDFDDYFKIYAPKATKDLEVENRTLKEVMAVMTNSFLDKTANELNLDYTQNELMLEISEPIMIEKYASDKNASTIIALMKLSGKNSNTLMAFSMAIIIIKNRLIFVAHYQDYKDEESIYKLKVNTNNFVDAIILVN